MALLGTPHARAAAQLLPQLATWPELAHAYRAGVLDPWRTAAHTVATRTYARGETDDPAPVRLALEAAAAHICLQWLVDPESVAVGGPAGNGRVEDLVRTLISPALRA